MSAFALFSRQNPIVLGPPPSARLGSEPVQLSSSGLTSSARQDILPFGKVYWASVTSSLGENAPVGRTKGSKQKKASAVVDDFPDELIKIPLNVTPQTLKKFTLYDLLGLGEHSGSADENAIRKAYHKCVLIYHPDKKQDKTTNGTDDNTVWLKIQEAFSTLLDTKKRRAYDSQVVIAI